MRQPFPLTIISHQGLTTEWQGFALEESSAPPNITLIEGQIDLPSSRESAYTELVEVVVVSVRQSSIVQCGPINTPQHLIGLNAVMTKLTPLQEIINKAARKIVSLQLSHPESEWELIKQQDYLILKSKAYGLPIAHLCLSVEEFFIPEKESETDALHLKKIKKLERLQNIVGWLNFCSWLDDKFIELLSTIPLDGADEFPLEGTLKDFSHQRQSPLLQACLAQLENLSIQLGDSLFATPENESSMLPTELSQKEKEALELRIEMRSYLRSHLDLLGIIILQIKKIEPAHPNIRGFRAISELLKALLDEQIDFAGISKASFGQQFLQLSLLNTLLGVFPIFNSNDGINHTNICSSIAVAMMQLLESEEVDLTLKCILNFDDYCLSINKRIAGMGHERFANWLRQGSHNDELLQEARWVSQLRQHVYKNLTTVASRTIVTPLRPDAAVKANSSYLNFIPQQYVEYNRLTGIPESLTSKGKQFLTPCFRQ